MGLRCNLTNSRSEASDNVDKSSVSFLKISRKSVREPGRYFNNPTLLEINLSTDPNQVQQLFTYNCDDWISILLAMKGRSFPWRPWCIVMLLTILYVLVDSKYGFMVFGDFFDKDMNPVVHSTFGIVLGFLIVYQSRTSNARWWEARVAWQDIISNSRESMRILCCLCNGKEFIKLYGRYQIAFTVCVKHYLTFENFTENNPCPELAQILEPDDLRRLYKMSSRNRPLACLYALQRMIETAVRKNLFGRPVTRDLSPKLVNLAKNLGVCERILYTPLPWVYTLHLRFLMLLYLAYLPFALSHFRPVPSFYAVLFYSLIISYAYLGLEDMAVQMQNPFGKTMSDLPLIIFLQFIQDDIEEVFRMKYEQYNGLFTDKLEETVQNSEIRLEIGMKNNRFYPYREIAH